MKDYRQILDDLAKEGYDFDLVLYLTEGFNILKSYFLGFVGFFSLLLTLVLLVTLVFSKHSIGLEDVINGNFGIVDVVFYNLVPNVINSILQIIFSGLALLVINDVYRGNKPSFSSFFEGSKFILPLLIYGVLSLMLSMIGFFLFLLPGIFITIALMFSIYFIVFLSLDVGEAIAYSIKIITKKWWHFFALYMILSIMNLIFGLLTLGVGILVSVPLTVCITYVAFERIVGGAIRKAEKII